MPTFGLVLALKGRSDEREQVLTWLRADPRVQLGPLEQHRLALVLDTQTANEEAAFIERCMLSGCVRQVDIAYANFEDLVAFATGEETPDEHPA